MGNACAEERAAEGMFRRQPGRRRCGRYREKDSPNFVVFENDSIGTVPSRDTVEIPIRSPEESKANRNLHQTVVQLIATDSLAGSAID